MSSERDKILAMLEEGTISAAEANELLAAISAEDSADTIGDTAEFAWPDMPARGQAWQRPFNVALLGSATGATLLLSTRNATGFMRFVRAVFFWPLTIFSGVAALITYISKDSPWLHVRVHSDDGTDFQISLPFPARAMQEALRVARSNAPNDDVKEKIDAAAEFLAAMDTSNLKDPLVIDISDEGDSVQVYLN
jgi:hypothetical protein